MAVKKSKAGTDANANADASATAPTTGGAKKGAVKKKAGTPTKGATKKSGASAETAAKTGTPKGTKKAGAAKGAATKTGTTAAKKPAVKLNDKQRELLGKVRDAGETGYHRGAKPEERTLEALRERKLVKRGAKNKETGTHPYQLTKAGEKHLSTSSGS